MVRWVVGSILHGEPIELFLVPASGALAGMRYINSVYVFICITPQTDRIAHTTAFVTPVSGALAGTRYFFHTAYAFVCIIPQTG